MAAEAPGLAGCVGGQTRNEILYEKETDPGLIASGRQLVMKECSSCHAVDQSMKSPNPDAPPMRTVLSRYDPEMLADDLIEGIRVGHNEMPHFDFNVIAADSLIAYLKSISKN
jgi:mono/diheme cytochrome c family protein